MLIKNTLGLILVSSISFLNIVSCTSSLENKNNQNITEWWDKDIIIQVNPGWTWDTKGKAFSNAAKLLETKVNELKNNDKYSFKNKPDIKVTFIWSTSDSDAIIQNIVTKKYDLGFAAITAVMGVKQFKIQPLIQTETDAFTFDLEWKTYKSTGTNGDSDLRDIAAAQTSAFKRYYKKSNDNWNGVRYSDFYTNLSKKVDFYRGVIWVYGPNTEKAKIAWDQKDWNTFRDIGILHGSPKSGGRFQLQEKLLKKHFGKNAFTTLVEEMQKDPNKFKKAYAHEMKADGLYGIAFDNEGSFAWTKKENSGTINFNVSNAEILIVTEPLKYDVGSFRNNMDPRQAKLIATAFKELIEDVKFKLEKAKAKALSEIYGPNYGYNGYRLIKDRKTELEDTWNDVMGSE